MSRSDSPPPLGQHGLIESLITLILDSSQEMRYLQGQTSAKVDVLLQNQATNKADLQGEMRAGMAHVSQRIDDMLPRIASLEQAQRSSPEAPSFAVRWFGVVGVFLIEKLPWKHIVFLGSGVLIGVMGHVMPERVRALGTSLLEAWSKGLLPQ